MRLSNRKLYKDVGYTICTNKVHKEKIEVVRMNNEVLIKLEKALYKRYKFLQGGFVHTEIYNNMIVINYSPKNTKYIEYWYKKKLGFMQKFIQSFLIKHKQKGFYYIGGYVYEVV